jgi:hypothetical protein
MDENTVTGFCDLRAQNKESYPRMFLAVQDNCTEDITPDVIVLDHHYYLQKAPDILCAKLKSPSLHHLLIEELAKDFLSRTPKPTIFSASRSQRRRIDSFLLQ